MNLEKELRQRANVTRLSGRLSDQLEALDLALRAAAIKGDYDLRWTCDPKYHDDLIAVHGDIFVASGDNWLSFDWSE